MTNEHSHEQEPAQTPPRFDISPEAAELFDKSTEILDRSEAEILALRKGDADGLQVEDYLAMSRRISNRERQILVGRKIDSDGNFK